MGHNRPPARALILQTVWKLGLSGFRWGRSRGRIRHMHITGRDRDQMLLLPEVVDVEAMTAAVRG